MSFRDKYPYKAWNPISGCTKISPECRNCYAEKISLSLKQQGSPKYKNGFTLTLHPESLKQPLHGKKPAVIFICSMSDLFHQDVPDIYINKIIDIVRETPWHQYMILTKRAERMAEFFQTRAVPLNTWIGVTVGVKSSIPRINNLRKINARVRFINCEPLVEDLGPLDLTGIHWLSVGGESADQARPMKKEWIYDLQRQCQEQNVRFSFKQWGSWGQDGVKRSTEANGNILDGRVYNELPDFYHLQSEFLF